MNQSLFLTIHDLAGRNGFFDGVGIFFAEWLPYLLVAAFLVFVFRQPDTRRRFYVFAEGALAVILARGIVTTAIRFFYDHPRPFVFYGFMPLIAESGNSFPSGHAAWFFALSFVVWYTNRKWGWWFFGFTITMSLARIYVGVHWPLDVLGGTVVGLASAWFFHWLFQDTREALQNTLRFS